MTRCVRRDRQSKRATDGWIATGCVCTCVLVIGCIAACGGSDSAPRVPTATFAALPSPTPTPTNMPTATPCRCAPADRCHQAGACAADGTCSYLPVADGTPCTEGGSVCGAGTCRQPPLASLVVSPLVLRPAFSPSTFDYAMVCSVGINTVTLAMTASVGGGVSLNQPSMTAWAPAVTVTVSLTENQAAVIFARDATGFTQQYWIRCLPHDFPLVNAHPHPEAGSPTRGWYLLGNAFEGTGAGPYAMILDANGTPIWYHSTAADHGNPTVTEALPDSTVGVLTVSTPSTGTLYLLKTWTTQRIGTVGIPLDSHELLRLPNGNFMLLSYPVLTAVDLTGLRAFGRNSAMFDCVVQEVDPQGNLVWEWRASDHVDPVRESVVPGGVGTEESPADVYHCNSVDANASGDVLVSSRHANAVFLVAKATGRVVWKLGGTAYNKDGARILTVRDDPEGAFYLQHDARFQPNGDISLFDDHSAAAAVPGVARGVQYALDLVAGTAHVVWQYRAVANSAYLGSFRRYADGTNLIGWGDYQGADGLAFSEIDNGGNDLLDMAFVNQGAASYRAEKVPIGSFDIDVLRGTAGLP